MCSLPQTKSLRGNFILIKICGLFIKGPRMYGMCVMYMFFWSISHNNNNKRRRILERKIMKRKNVKYEFCNPQHQQLVASLIWYNCNPTITFNPQYYSVLSLRQNPQPHKIVPRVFSFRQNPRSHKTFHCLQLLSVFTHLPTKHESIKP